MFARSRLLALLITVALGSGLVVGAPGRVAAADGPRFGASSSFRVALAKVDAGQPSRAGEQPARQLKRPGSLLHPKLALDHGRPDRPGPAASRPVLQQQATNSSNATSDAPKALSSSGWLGMDNTVNDAYFGCYPSELCLEPPDPAVAVGPSDIAQTVNTNLRVYSRSGVVRATTQLETIFGTEYDSFTSDPQIVYHEPSGRWFMTIISADCYTGYLHLAVSDTSDPAGTWSTYTYEYPGALPDYPGLGVSDDKIVIGVNEYALDSYYCAIGDYIGTSALITDIPDILDNSGDAWALTTTPNDYFWDLRPALNESGASDAHAIVTDYYGYYSDLLITGSVVDYVYGGIDPLSIYSYDLSLEFSPEEWLVPPVQPGGELEVDGRVTSAVWSVGRLVFVSTYPCLTNAIYDCVRVSELDTNSETRRQDFLLGDTVNAYDSYMGGITVTDAGTLYVVWTRSSSFSPASILASYQPSSTALNTVQPYTLVSSGAGSYVGDRWGDFVILATDPTSNDAIWQADEFAGANGGWATYVSRLTAVTTPGAPTGVSATPGNASAIVSWSSPASDGGAPVSSYTATSAPSGLTCTSAGLSCTVSGLANGTPYIFNVTATNAAGAGPASAPSVPVTPTAPPPPPSLSINDVSAAENGGSLLFTVSLSGANAQVVTVAFGTADGSATAPADYAAASGTTTFNPGETTKTISVPLIDDTLNEANETFTVNLSSPTNATIADGQGVGTIVDNDAPSGPTISISDASVVEGSRKHHTVKLVFAVTLSQAVNGKVKVHYTTANGTATAVSDYVAKSGTLKIKKGHLTGKIVIKVRSDRLAEPNETLYVNLSSAFRAVIGDGQGVGTIVNDD